MRDKWNNLIYSNTRQTLNFTTILMDLELRHTSTAQIDQKNVCWCNFYLVLMWRFIFHDYVHKKGRKSSWVKCDALYLTPQPADNKLKTFSLVSRQWIAGNLLKIQVYSVLFLLYSFLILGKVYYDENTFIVQATFIMAFYFRLKLVCIIFFNFTSTF